VPMAVVLRDLRTAVAMMMMMMMIVSLLVALKGHVEPTGSPIGFRVPPS